MQGFIRKALLVGAIALAGCATTRAGSPGDGYYDDGDEFSDEVPPPPVPPEDVVAEPAAQVTVDGFYDQLSPYGEWVVLAGYGRVWRPYRTYVGGEFRPYASGGHWVYTPYGWSFVSDYPFGWAVYHYGRWALDVSYGWVWVPDVTWGPAWVDWRWGGGYVGWAPLPPVGWRTTYYDPYWAFVESSVFVRADVNVYIVPRERVRYVYQATAPVETTVRYGGHSYCPGPSAAHVARVTGTHIRPVPIQTVGGHPVPNYGGGGARPVPSYPNGGGYAHPTSPNGGGYAHPSPASPNGGGYAHPVPSYPNRGGYQSPAPANPAPPVMNERRHGAWAPSAPNAPNPPPFQRYSPPAATRPYAAPAYPQRGAAPTFRAPENPRPAPTFRAAPAPAAVQVPRFNAPPQRGQVVRPGKRR